MRLLFVLLTLSLAPLSQAADPSTGAAKIAKAFETQDYSTVVDSTFPKVLELGGGREAMLGQVKEAMGKMKDQGITITAVTLGKPGPLISGKEQIFSIVPMAMTLETNEVVVNVKSFLLAISEDRGATWTYVDGSALTAEMMTKVFPKAPESLKLPPKSEPTVRKK